jgi:hypothetical protein
MNVPKIRPALLGVVIVLGWGGLGRADYPQSFRDGLRAVDFRDWPRVAAAMRQAIAQQPRSTGENVRVYGTRVVPYIPQYFLGLALYRQGDCDGAVRAFTEAEAQGTVRGIYRARLDIYQDVCAQRIGRPRPAVPGPPVTIASGSNPPPGASRRTPPPLPSVPSPAPDPGPAPSTQEVRQKALRDAVREGQQWISRGEKLLQDLKKRRVDPLRAENLKIAERRLQEASFRLEGCRLEGDIEGAESARDHAQATWELLEDTAKGR